MTWFDFELEGSSSHLWAWLIAGCCAAFSTIVTLWLIRDHLIHYRLPRRQKLIIRILFMVPIYSIESFLSLIFIKETLVFVVPREAYEAFVIYNFFLLCVELCGGEEVTRRHFAAHRPLKHMFPCSCCGTFNMPLLLDTCRFFILQYSLVKPTTAIITLALYGTSRLKTSAIFWIAVINNASVSIALYYLIAFYQAAKSNASFVCAKPFAKFMSVKLIVFFVFWQSLFISTLSAFGWIKSSKTDDREELATGFSDFLICVEMAIMSICHCMIYSASEHQYGFFVLQNIENPLDVKTVEHDPSSAMIDVLLMQDLLEDVLQMAKSMPRLGQHSMEEVARRAKPPAGPVVLVDRYHWNSRQAQRSRRESGEVPLGSTAGIESSADVVQLRRQIQEARSPEERLDRRAELARIEHSQQLASGYNGLFDSVQHNYSIA